uniref:Integrase, catalytic region, zinc finger, CCHC-type, peptidase aspartic, catalytic n=1 Tax=Tanacetum cinerariifolium TaxID=118510 RepID=A0A6L2P9Q9_TANCI|nr:integrase, catalytic region, zinc finger, CCHC-type, peptidase aspartic, catalytic [Tanacetum cinerariifolium]
MANLLEYIQCAGFDTRPPMLDRTDFASWKQCIRLYCQGKENRVNILKSIDEGSFQIGTVREPLVEGTEGAPYLGPKRPRVYSDLYPEEKDRYNADIKATNILLQELPKDIYTIINHYTDTKDTWDNVKMLLEGSELTKEDRESKLYDDFEHFRQHKGETIHDYYVRFVKLINDMRNIKMTMSRMQLNSKFVNNMLPEWVQDARVVVQNVQGRQNRGQGTNPRGGGAAGYGGVHNRVGNANLDKMLLIQAQENEVALDEEQLLFLAGGQDNAIDEDAPTAQTKFMAILSSADPVYDAASPSYDSNILSEVHDHDHYQDVVCEHHEEHVMHDNVQLNHVVDSHTDYTSDSNMILYDQYLNDNVVPEMKDVFKELEAEVAQNVVDRKHDEIEWKNLLITNDNLIAECLSKEVFIVATNSELNVARITKMHVAHTIVEARCLELEAELSNLHGKSHSDNHNELVNRFSNLKVTALTTKNVNLKDQILNTVNSVSKDHVKPIVLTPGKYAIDVEPLTSRLRNNRDAHLDYLRHLKESVETIRDIVEEAKVVRTLDSSIISACRYTKHSQELLEYAIGTCPNTHKHVAKLNTQKTNVPVPPSTGLNRCTDASGSQPRSNTKKNRISPAKGVNKMQVKEQPRTNKSYLRTTNHVDSTSRSKSTVINLNSDSVCQTCNKCLISPNHDMCVVGYLQSIVSPPSIHNNCNVMRKVKQVWKPKQVRQVWKPTCKVLTSIGHQWRPTAKIFTLEVQCPLTRVYFVERLGYNLFSVRQFCDSDLEVAFRKHSCYVRDTDDVELIKGSRGSNLYTISVEDMMKSSPICLLSKASKNKSWLWHRRLNHLNFDTINKPYKKRISSRFTQLKFEKDHLCSVCQLGKSKKRTHKHKNENTNLEVLNILHMDLCGLMRVQTINGKKYILIIVDDYSRFMWVKFFRSKDETPEVVIKFLQQI